MSVMELPTSKVQFLTNTTYISLYNYITPPLVCAGCNNTQAAQHYKTSLLENRLPISRTRNTSNRYSQLVRKLNSTAAPE